MKPQVGFIPQVYGKTMWCLISLKPMWALYTHGGGSVMIWSCMKTKGLGEMTFISGTMNVFEGIKILTDTSVFLHDSDPKHTATSTQEFPKQEKVKTVTWTSMLPHLSPREQLCCVLYLP
uniref:Tc1-like transposase DDE domain-containing protein n=1 Tax=Acanthochromis polyacanthus TaxID=80966 RepID=A0A3Q1FSB6_9TELE